MKAIIDYKRVNSELTGAIMVMNTMAILATSQ